MFRCKGNRVLADAEVLKTGYGGVMAKAVNAASGSSPAEKAHVCEDTVKLAAKEYDERRAAVLKDWKGIVNPYRIRRDEALGVFVVERAEEHLPDTAAEMRERRCAWYSPMAATGGWAEFVLSGLRGEVGLPGIRWLPLTTAGFGTLDAAHRWLLQFIDPAHGTTEFTADGSPATATNAAPKAAPKSRPRKG